MKKPKLKLPKSKRMILIIGFIGIVLLSCVGAIIILAATQPEISSGMVKNDLKTPEESLTVNAEGRYPTVVLGQDDKAQLRLETGKIIANGEYKFSEKDLKEGENSVYLRKIMDLGLVKLVSKDEKKFTIAVDRVAPDFKYTQPAVKYTLVNDYSIKVETEPGLTVEIADNEGKSKKLKTFPAADSALQNLTIPSQQAQNNVVLRVVDSAGNPSPEVKFDFYAFKREGFQIADCGGFIYPFSTKAWQYGFKNYPGKPCGKGAKDISSNLTPKDTLFP